MTDRVRMKGVWAVATTALLIVSACGGGSSSSGGGSGVDPVSAGIVGDLASSDPARVEDGVNALLQLLGVGVYTPDGQQVLAGSERVEDDFWLYDFEIPILVEMASGAATPFDAFAEVVRAQGYTGSADDLREAYRQVYADHPDHPIPQFLTAAGVDFEDADLRITPLVQWVLLLDTFVPPNGLQADRRSARSAPAGTCGGTISGGNLASFWGLAGTETGMVLAGYQAYLAIHGNLLSQAATAGMEASADEIHEGHGGPGGAVDVTVTVQADYTPQQVVNVGCGVLVDTNWQPLSGPLAGAQVSWELPWFLEDHATVVSQDPLTDADGEAALRIQAVQEEANGQGTLQQESGTVQAYVDLKAAYQAAGITSPQLLALVPPRFFAGAAPLTVSWHEAPEACDGFVLRYEWTLDQSAPGYSSRVQVAGAVDVTIDLGNPALPVSGQAELPLTGQGQIDGACSWTLEGSDRVTVTGNVAAGEGGDPPQAVLTVHHEQTGQMSPADCGFWIPLVFDEEITLPLENGAGGEASSSGVTASYTVELSCQPDL